MDRCIVDTLSEHDVKGVAATLASENLFATRDCPKLPADEAKAFHSHVARLLNLANRVRPGLLTAVIFLATRVQSPDTDDRDKLDRVMRYLNGTRNLGLRLSSNHDTSVEGYVDASYGVHPDGRSHTLGKGAYYARSAKQKLTTKSSAEA